MSGRGRPSITLREKIIRKIARLQKEIEDLQVKLTGPLAGDEPEVSKTVEVPVEEVSTEIVTPIEKTEEVVK